MKGAKFQGLQKNETSVQLIHKDGDNKLKF